MSLSRFSSVGGAVAVELATGLGLQLRTSTSFWNSIRVPATQQFRHYSAPARGARVSILDLRPLRGKIARSCGLFRLGQARAVARPRPFFSGVPGFAIRLYSQQAQTQAQAHSHPKDGPTQSGRRKIWVAIAGGLLLLWIGKAYVERRSRRLQQEYGKFRLVRRDELSANSAVLTFVPDAGVPDLRPKANGRFQDEQLKWGLWSISIVKDDIMVERSYTPLPLSLSTSERPRSESLFRFLGWIHDLVEIQLYIRAVEGGEVSKWLFSLQPGEIVRMRGPDIDYNLQSLKCDTSGSGPFPLIGQPLKQAQPTRVKQPGANADNVVVLAGGTGVASALQAAVSTLSAKPDAKVSILWANRRREDMAVDHPQSIVALVKRLQEMYPGRVSMQVYIDEDNGFIGAGDIQKLIMQESGKSDENVLVVCGSEGFVRYYTGRTDPGVLGCQIPKGSITGVLGRSKVPDNWRIVGLW